MAKVYAKARNGDPSLLFNERQMQFSSGHGFAVDIRVRDWPGNASQRYAEGAIIGFWESEDDAKRIADEVNRGVRYQPGDPFYGRAYDAIVVPAWNAASDPNDPLPWETSEGSAAMVAAYEKAGVPLPGWLQSTLEALKQPLTEGAHAVPPAVSGATNESIEFPADYAMPADVADPDWDALLDSLYEIQPEVHDGKRSPYQFVVLLHAISGARQKKPRLRPYQDIKLSLKDLLSPFQLAESSPNPANPWFALGSSEWWEIAPPEPSSYKDVPKFNTVAGLIEPIYQEVARNSAFTARAVETIRAIVGADTNLDDLCVNLGISQLTSERPAPTEAAHRVSVENHLSERFSVERKALAATARERREAKLQEEYRRYLLAMGHPVSRYKIPVDGQYLYTDLHDEELNELIEVKASVDRVTMRLALGQVLDYARLISPSSAAVVVPERPSQGIIDLFREHGIRLIWPNDAAGFDATS